VLEEVDATYFKNDYLDSSSSSIDSAKVQMQKCFDSAADRPREDDDERLLDTDRESYDSEISELYPVRETVTQIDEELEGVAAMDDEEEEPAPAPR